MTFFAEHAHFSRDTRAKRQAHRTVEQIIAEDVRLQKIPPPDDYHCRCRFCERFGGVLMRDDGSFYSKIDRAYYYSRREVQHVAKTPLHLARYCIQQYTEPGDWVLDPTMGAGTTAVEAIVRGRNAFGIELQFNSIVTRNVEEAGSRVATPGSAILIEGDARNVAALTQDREFSLVVNNPPYSGDETQKEWRGQRKSYDHSRRENLAFLDEGVDYWRALREIYSACVERLRIGGHVCVGVKDMIRCERPFLLHFYIAEVLQLIPQLQFVETILLPHYPATMFMNTYPRRCPGVPVPMYQTILIFRKVQ